MSASGDEFLTVAEIAALVKINPMTVRNWIFSTPRARTRT